MLTNFQGEFIGTFLLLLIGEGVVANVILDKTKGHNSGWIVIAFGWAMAVFIGVFASQRFGGSGHLNPAVTLALSIVGDTSQDLIAPYLLAQLTGAMAGSFAAWICYKPHFDITEDKDLKLAAFCTSPAIRNVTYNFLSEFIGTFVLMFGALAITPPQVLAKTPLGTFGALPVALLVLAIGLGLGGTTGYAINPARDLGPRIMHAMLPIRGKRDSDWSYSWIPVIAPIAGAMVAALVALKVL